VLTYAIEHREATPAGLREIADNLIGAVKAWALRTFGKQFGDVTPGQLHALAVAALRSWKDAPATVSADRGARYSMAAPPTQQTKGEARCLIPLFDGAIFSSGWKDALWARFSTGAPARQRRRVERYNIVKRA